MKAVFGPNIGIADGVTIWQYMDSKNVVIANIFYYDETSNYTVIFYINYNISKIMYGVFNSLIDANHYLLEGLTKLGYKQMADHYKALL